MEKTEVHILTEIAAGNIQAFEQLFFRYQPKLVCFLAGLTHDSELSRDTQLTPVESSIELEVPKAKLTIQPCSFTVYRIQL